MCWYRYCIRIVNISLWPRLYLNISRIRSKYKGGGMSSFHSCMTRVLVLSYLSDVCSCRKIERHFMRIFILYGFLGVMQYILEWLTTSGINVYRVKLKTKIKSVIQDIEAFWSTATSKRSKSALSRKIYFATNFYYNKNKIVLSVPWGNAIRLREIAL